MKQRKFELDEEVYFYTNIATSVNKGKIVGLWFLGKEGEEIYNYIVEFMGDIVDVKGNKKKGKTTQVVEESQVTRDREEMKKNFLDYVKKAITNKIKLVKEEVKECDKRIGFIKDEKVEHGKFIIELEEKLEGYKKGEGDIFEE